MLMYVVLLPILWKSMIKKSLLTFSIFCWWRLNDVNVIGILWRLQKAFIFVNIWNFVCRGHNSDVFTIFLTKTLQFLSLFWLSIISCSYSTVDFDFHGCFHWRQKIGGNFKHHYLKKKEAIVHTISIYMYRRFNPGVPELEVLGVL